MALWLSRFQGPISRTSARCSRSSTSAIAIASLPVFDGIREARILLSARCLLGLFDDAGMLQHVGVCASFTQEKRRQLVEYLAPYRRDALINHPWKAWAEHGAEAGGDGASDAGRTEPLESGQGPIMGAAAARASRRSAYEHMQRRALPSHVAVSQMAPRQEGRVTVPMRNSKWFLRKS